MTLTSFWHPDGTPMSSALFLDFVLSHYVSSGVDELAREKLHPLLRLRYRGSIADAVAELGSPADIGRAFSDFQKYLYAEAS